MPISKVISYVNDAGQLLTTTVSFDIESRVINDSEDEKVFLVASAPGLTADSFWRRSIDGLIADAIFATASGGLANSQTRYLDPPVSGQNYGGYGDKISNNGLVTGISGVQGLRQQLINRANS